MSVTIQELKRATGHTSEAIFDIPAQPYSSCHDIDRSIKDLTELVKDVVDSKDDEKDMEFYQHLLKGDIKASLNERREQIERVREWGQQWKDLAKDLFNELASIDERTAMRYIDSEEEKIYERERHMAAGQPGANQGVAG